MRNFLKFGLIGVLNTLVTFLVFNVLLLFFSVSTGLVVSAFYCIAYGAGLVHSFIWNKRWVFAQNHANATVSEFIRFAAVTITVGLACAALLQSLIAYPAPYNLTPHLWANVAFLLTIPLSTLGNFFGYHVFVFKKSGDAT